MVHLGGLAQEAPWEEILHVNVHGTWCVLEAAHQAGVGRVILASSNHAAGYLPLADVPPGGLPAAAPPRPDSYYGWSKTAIEPLGRLYADSYGMDVLCLRIGSCFELPPGPRSLATWLSPDDAGRLVEACLTVHAPGYRIVWGVSRNTRRWCSLAESEAIGYFPQDDSERYAAAILTDDAPAGTVYAGGSVPAGPLGERDLWRPPAAPGAGRGPEVEPETGAER